MCDRYSGYASFYGGTPVSGWDRDRSFNSLENQIQQQYSRRVGQTRCWGSMSEGGGVAGAGDSCKTNLIVNYLPQTMTEKDLYAMFMTIGPIESCRVMKDFKTGYSYGFGFVNFTREEDATRAIETFNGYQLRNKRLKVSYARPSGDDIKDTNLYVTNLPRAITEEQLETIFGKYGRIVQKHILRDKSNGTPRGVAFVRFDKREEAQEAIAALNNVIPEGGTEPLSVKSCGRSADAAMARLQPACSRSYSRSRLQSDMSVEYGPETAYGRFAPVNSTIPGPGPGLCSRSGSRGRLHSDSLGSEWSTQYPQTTKGRIGFAPLPTRGLNSRAGSRAQLYSDALCTERETRAQAVGRRSLPTLGLRARAGSHTRLHHDDCLNADLDPLTSLRQFSSLPATGSLPASGLNSRSGSRTRLYSDSLNTDLGPTALTRLVSASLPTGSLPASSSLPASGLNSRSNSRSRLHDMNAEWGVDSGACASGVGVGAGALVRFGSATLPSYGQASRTRLNSDTLVAEEHGKQKAAYYAGWAAGFHHNRGDFAWPCGNCMMDPWDKIPPLGGSYPTTPRNGCRPGVCANTRMYPNYLPGKGTPRSGRGRNLPWAPGFGGEERYKGQRCRSGPAPYW